MPELAFVLAPQQNVFFVELAEALGHELRALGVDCGVHHGAFPPPRPGRVYGLLPPHEYFSLTHGRVGAPSEVLDRTLYLCAEQPGTSHFEDNLRLAPAAGAVFDINRVAVREFRSQSIAAEHLQLGWTDVWDRRGERERDIDVLFLGCATERRLAALGSYARQLRHRRCHYVISDNARPNWRPSATFVGDEDKWDLLSRSKVLINLHQGELPYFEWLRVVQAMANGCAVVSERSRDVAPLQPGEHLLTGRVETLGLLTERLLTDEYRRHGLAEQAYHRLRDGFPLKHAAQRLADAVRRLDERPVPDAGSRFFTQPPPDAGPARLERLSPQPPETLAQEIAPLKRAIKDIKLDLIDLRRSLAQVSATLAGATAPPIRIVDRTRAWTGARPRVSVLLTLFNYADVVTQALGSLLHSHEPDWEVIIVDDGSDDGSVGVARAWLGRHQAVPALLLEHPVNRGLGHARNAALAFARAPLCFVLDADNLVFPEGFGRLREALEADPAAAFAYGMHERLGRTRATGLLNWLPWDPTRFRLGNYIDAMALIRTAVLRDLGGYRTDRRLHGWEDYDLWCRIAEAGGRGAFVRDVVAAYRATEHSMIATTNISPVEVYSLIAERSPTVIGEEQPPL